MVNTIYDEDVWERIIEKYKLKELSTKLGLYKDPQKAKEMVKLYKRNFGIKKLSEEERDFCNELVSIEFVEQDFLDMLVSTGTDHIRAGAGDYVGATMELILVDFEDSYKDFICELEKRGKTNDGIPFEELYEVFLDVIKLKMKYKVPYTKLFIRRLLEISPDCYKREDSLEIEQYFIKNNPELLLEIKSELIS